MSDGPHKSLTMSRKWRKAAELADTTAFDSSDVADALCNALAAEFQNEVPRRLLDWLKQMFDGGQQDLFDAKREATFREGERLAAGFPLGRTLVNYARFVVVDGNSGEDGALRTIELTLADRIQRGERQVEEHYLRESSRDRAEKVRLRLRDASDHRNVSLLPETLLAGRKSATKSSRRGAIDDGPQL